MDKPRIRHIAINVQDKVLKFLTETVGADRLLMGTDYSGDMSAWRGVPKIGNMEFLTVSQMQQNLGGNAALA